MLDCFIGYIGEYPYPKENLACITCRIPVLGPNVPIQATGIMNKKEPKMMTREAVRRSRPYTSVPDIPVVILRTR